MSTSNLRRIRNNPNRRDTGGWFNARNGFGTSSDPQAVTHFATNFFMSRDLADAMYQHDWLTRKAINSVPEDETRKWIDILPTENDDDEKLRDALEELDIRALFKEARINARLQGGALLVLGVNDGQDPVMPLEIDRVKTVPFAFVVDRYHAIPNSWYTDPDHPKFGKVETYRVDRLEMARSHTAVVHESRVLRFEGNYVTKRARLRRFGWGASMLETIFTAIRDWGTAKQVSAGILQDFITMVMKIENIRELISNNDKEAIQARIDMALEQRSIHNMLLIGEGEEVEKKITPTTGLIEFVNFFTDIVCAATEVPRSRLIKSEGGALGGDGGAGKDLENYYDRVAENQRNILSPRLRRVIDIVSVAEGIDSDNIEWEFAPLAEVTEVQRSEINLRNAQADNLYLTQGVFTAEEVAIARAANPEIHTPGIMISEGRMKEVQDILATGPVDEPEPVAPPLPPPPVPPQPPEDATAGQ